MRRERSMATLVLSFGVRKGMKGVADQGINSHGPSFSLFLNAVGKPEILAVFALKCEQRYSAIKSI